MAAKAAPKKRVKVLIADDQTLFREGIKDLLENAIRHTPKGGVLSVKVERDGSDVRFAVIDNGDGIAAADQSRLFESFYQGAGGAGGRLGLGLSISREIVHSHKGRIWVESPGLGKGATFLFTIPASS